MHLYKQGAFRIAIRRLIGIFVLLSILSCSSNSTPDRQQAVNSHPAQTTNGDSFTTETTLRLNEGIDVSKFSGRVDWPSLVKQGYSFAFTKATEGVDLKDSAFEDNWKAMKQAGIVRGAYHFYVTEDDPRQQAQFFIDTVKLEAGDLAPVVDVELVGHHTQPGLADRLKVWLDLIEQHYRIRPIIYTNAKFWNKHFNKDFGDYPLWIAEYDVNSPTLPNGWTNWHFWQWRSDADLAGVEKEADLNRINPLSLQKTELILAN
ncbi:MAG: GH25 family lysozyme [Candidatus Thiodiazotropha sp.]